MSAVAGNFNFINEEEGGREREREGGKRERGRQKKEEREKERERERKRERKTGKRSKNFQSLFNRKIFFIILCSNYMEFFPICRYIRILKQTKSIQSLLPIYQNSKSKK